MSSLPLSIHTSSYEVNDSSDDMLIATLVNDLRLEGGACRLDEVIVLNTRIRKLLGDRKLLSFFKEHPFSDFVFRIESMHCKSEGAAMVVLLTQWLTEDALQ